MIYFAIVVMYLLLTFIWLRLDHDAPFLIAQLAMGFRHGGVFMMQAFGYTVALLVLMPIFALYRIWVSISR